MSSELVTIRYPDGAMEYALGAKTPKVGDTIKRGEVEWQVIAVATDDAGHPIATLVPK